VTCPINPDVRKSASVLVLSSCLACHCIRRKILLRKLGRELGVQRGDHGFDAIKVDNIVLYVT